MRRLLLLTILIGAGLSLSCRTSSEPNAPEPDQWAWKQRGGNLYTYRSHAGTCYVIVAGAGYGQGAITVAATPKDCE